MTRITTHGRAWHDPAGGTTAWQREVARGELLPMRDTPRRALSRATLGEWLATALFAIAFCCLVLGRAVV